MKKLITYKGFDKNLKCRDFQYEIGKQYTDDGAIRCGNKGFHSCENPLDVFFYYSPGENNRFSECEATGIIDKDNLDTKIASSELFIKVEIGLKELLENGIKFIFKKVNFKKGNSTTGDRSGAQATGYSSGAQATGDRSGAQATGYRSGAQATGDRSGAQATGDRSGAQATGYSSGAQATGYRSGAQATGDSSGAQATGDSSGAQATGYRSGAQATGDSSMACVNGNYSKSEIIGKEKGFACGFGINNIVKGCLNSWLILSEYDDHCKLKWVKTIMVDGKKIKENKWYKLKYGKFIKAE